MVSHDTVFFTPPCGKRISDEQSPDIKSLGNVSPSEECISKYDPTFISVSPKYRGSQTIIMPPTWKEQEPVRYTFILFSEELSPEELHRFFLISTKLGIENPRPISRQLLELSSLFHPLYYSSFVKGRGRLCSTSGLAQFLDSLEGYRLLRRPTSNIGIASVPYYLQSVLFLAGCTLSAAVVQNRFSLGTIESKLNRLWQASQYAQRFDLKNLLELKLDEFVLSCDSESIDTIARLISIKKMYGKALHALSDGIFYKKHYLSCKNLSPSDKDRFGFIEDLRMILKNNLLSIIVYGSAVTSKHYSDYDLVLVVSNARQALKLLAGLNPTYKGKEINLSVYDENDTIGVQLMSGDNLNHNARCIYGETEIPIKYSNDLLLRNFSFGFIRLRQLLGMAGYLSKAGIHGGLINQTNLYEYFVKIPMHVMKGILSVVNEPIAKEIINDWTHKELGYDLDKQMKLIASGQLTDAIANAYFATYKVLERLNERYQVYEQVPRKEADLWSYL